MTDNTMTVQDYLDQVAERLMANHTPAYRMDFNVPSRLAHKFHPFDRPYIGIHLDVPRDKDSFYGFPGDNATECMEACEEWLCKFERKVA